MSDERPPDARPTTALRVVKGFAIVILVLAGLILLAPGGFCVVIGWHDNAMLDFGLMLMIPGALCILAAIGLARLG